jgi:hypothetical protein
MHFIKKNGDWLFEGIYNEVSISGGARNYSLINNSGELAIASHGTEAIQPWPLGDIFTVKTIGDKLKWKKLNSAKSFYHSVATGDMNSDGTSDVFGIHMGTYGNWGDEIHSYLLNKDSSYLEARGMIDFTNYTDNYQKNYGSTLLVADIDNDNKNELIKGAYGYDGIGNKFSFLFFKYDSITNKIRYYSQPDQLGIFRDGLKGSTSIKTADIDNDGDKDMVVVIEGPPGGGVQIWLNDGKGNFRPDQIIYTYESEYGFREFELADINNDGQIDLLLHPNANGNKFRINPRPHDPQKNPWGYLGDGIMLQSSIYLNNKGKFIQLNAELKLPGLHPDFMKGYHMNNKLKFIGFEEKTTNNNSTFSDYNLSDFYLYEVELTFCKNLIKTIMGPVELKRAIYETPNEDGKKTYVYLLDEYLNLETIGKMSSNLVEKTIENATVLSFRKAAKNVTELTGQPMSHGAAWNLVQKIGKRIEEHENEKVEKFKNGMLEGDKEVKIIFEEADGLWLSMQGKDRPKTGKSRKKEIKLAVSYEGWEKRSGKKEAYQVINKKVVSGFMKPEEFKYLRDASLAETYKMDEIEMRILNGDGAAWIRNGHDNEGDYFQLDKFHISQAIVRSKIDKKEVSKLIKIIREGKTDELFKRLTELKFECGGEYEVVKKIETIETYLKSNRDGITPYQMRVIVPDAPAGIYYRNLGTMEHNIFDVLGYRMKGHKMSWSIKGAHNLAKILATKASGKLYETISELIGWKLPERLTERFTEEIKNTANKFTTMKKKIKLYPVHESSIPFGQCAKTLGRKAIRNIFNNKFATELIYR